MLTSGDLMRVLSAMVRIIVREETILGDLDAAIGDGDHGVNMVVGFRAVEEELPLLAGADMETTLGHVGTTIMAAIGGAAGPLYSAAFTEAATAVGRVHTAGLSDLAAMLEAARDGVMRRGRSNPGEKTMLDTLDWAAREARRCVDSGLAWDVAAERIAAAAAAGLLSTRDMAARRGRARWQFEQALDHLDPGAASCYLLIATACGCEAALAPLMRSAASVGSRRRSEP